jgi:glucokinase
MGQQYAIGIDLGGTNLRIALVSRQGEIIEKIKEPTSEKLLESILAGTEKLFSGEVTGIGLGVAGLISRETRRVLVSPNLHLVEEIDVVLELSRKFEVPVTIENDANVAAFGELWAGAGRDLSNFVLLTLGTGIGGGIVREGKLLRVAAEIGHMSINADGEKCGCGNYGCLELYASARAIISRASSALEAGRESILREYWGGNFYKLSPEDIHKAAFDGDTLARELLKNAGRFLGIGIANIINCMSPEAIVLAGGLTGAWDLYVQEAMREASRRALKELFDGVSILPALLGDDAGLIGAAGLVFHSLDSSLLNHSGDMRPAAPPNISGMEKN